MKSLFLKCLLIVLFLFSIIDSTTAQELKERRIYYLDCSYSMKWRKINNKKTEIFLWEKVTENLLNAIDSVTDSSAELMVVKFAQDNSGMCEPLFHDFILADKEGKERLKNAIRDIPTPDNSSTMTYIEKPLEDFYNGRVNPNRLNYMFLMTDGQPDNPRACYDSLRKWGGKYGQTHTHVYGFYVMLDPLAGEDSQISNIIGVDNKDFQKRNHLWKVGNADVNINLITLDTFARYNVRKDTCCIVPVYNYVSGVNIIPLLAGNDNYKIKSSNLVSKNESTYLVINIEPLKDTSLLPPYTKLEITYNDNITNDMTFLVSEGLTIGCVNDLKPALTNISVEGIENGNYLGEVSYTPPFLSESMPITDAETKIVQKTFVFTFEKDAIAKKDTCRAFFQFVDGEGNVYKPSELEIKDGNDSLITQFEVNPLDARKTFVFRFVPGVPEGRHDVRLKLIACDSLKNVMDYAIAETPSPIVVSYTIGYNEHINCLWWWLIALILLMFLAWRIREMVYDNHAEKQPHFPNRFIRLCSKNMNIHYVLVLGSHTYNLGRHHDEYLKKIIFENGKKERTIKKSRWNGNIISIPTDFYGIFNNIRRIELSPYDNNHFNIKVDNEQPVTVDINKHVNEELAPKICEKLDENHREIKLCIYTFIPANIN